MPTQFNFSLINLGCTKNLVDSQHFLGRLFDMSLKTPEYQLNYFTDPFDTNTNIVFLNTCAFISSGRDEASETVKKLLKAKKTVYLLGCAVQYYKKLQKKIRVGLIDNGSSFIHSLSKTLQELHYDVHILPSSQIDTIKENDYDFFVLSGMKHGRSVMRHAELYKKEIAFVQKCSKPLLGICLGHEIVCKAFDSTLVELPQKQEGAYPISFGKNNIFTGKKIHVYEGHKFGVTTLGKDLVGLAKSKYGYEIIQHKTKPIFGFQFHPEQTKISQEGLTAFKEALHHLGLTNEPPIKNVYYLSRGDLNKVNLKNIMQGYDSTSYGDFEFASSPRVYTNLEQKFEYLKIAEGCDNHCTFCIIPAIRGKQQSLTIEKILAEAKNMIANGIKEIILIAQDTTRYGTDIYGKPQLLELLKKLDAVKGDFTYRLLYLYPDIVTLNQVKELKKLKKLIPYFDIPLQHISSPVLKKMGRFYDEGYIIQFIDQIKKTFPVRFIRTNLIIGFPGETKEDFDKLVHFVDETKFDNIALFEYHDEPLAASSKLPNKVDDHEIRTRFTKLRQLVNRQLLDHEQARKGKEEIGYIMETEKGTLVVRPQLHCPEIDSYDEISLKQVLGTFEDKTELEIGDKIVYTV